MSVKIRLSRHGRKRYAYYHIVVADSRAPRDGRFIERIGSYNPNTNPATIDLDIDKALQWLGHGAQPTDTVHSILSKKGVLMKKHLLDGVKKGAFDNEEAERRFLKWQAEKEAKINAQKEQLKIDLEKVQKSKFNDEIKVNEERKIQIAKKNAELLAAEAAAAAEKAQEKREKEKENVNEISDASNENIEVAQEETV